MKLKDILNAQDLKSTIAIAGKTAAGSALQKVMAKDQVRSLVAQEAERVTVETAGAKAFKFWQQHKMKIIVGGAIVGGLTLVGVTWLILKRKKG